MAKLILKRFHCVDDTDESGAESPYFLTFVGDIATGKTAIKRTRQGNWENEVDKGENWTVNETVAEGFDFVPSKTIALAAMVEEDEGVDVSPQEVESIRQALKTKLDNLRAAGVTVVNSEIRNSMKAAFKLQIQAKLLSSSGADDDLMGVKPIPVTGQPGELGLVKFLADTGQYNVRYGHS